MHLLVNRERAKAEKQYRDAVRKSNAVQFFGLLNLYLAGLLWCALNGALLHAVAVAAVLLLTLLGSAALVMQNPIGTLIGFVGLYRHGFTIVKSWVGHNR